MQDDRTERRAKPPKSAPRGRPRARLSSIQEIAEYLHVSRQTVYRLIEHKGLPHLRIGYVLRFDLPVVLAWAESFTKSGDRLTWLDDYPELKARRRGRKSADDI